MKAGLLPRVILCALLWGSAFPLIKSVYRNWPEQPLALCLVFAGIRFVIAGGGLLACTPDRGRKLRRAGWRLVAILALTQTFFQYFFFYAGMKVSSGVLGSLLVACGSFWWVFLAPPLLGTPLPSRRQWICLAGCSAGIVLAVYAPGAGSGDVVLGSLCFLAASFTGALALIAIRRLGTESDARAVTGASLAGGGVALLAAGLPAIPLFLSLLTWKLAAVTIFLAAVSAVAFSVWNALARDYSVNLLANYRFLIPLSGVIQSSAFIAGESPGPGIIVGGALILGSLYLLQRRSPSSSNRAKAIV